MNKNEFIEKLENSSGLKFIVAGLVNLVEDEGHSVHEVFEMLEDTKRNIFTALLDIGNEVKK